VWKLVFSVLCLYNSNHNIKTRLNKARIRSVYYTVLVGLPFLKESNHFFHIKFLLKITLKTTIENESWDCLELERYQLPSHKASCYGLMCSASLISHLCQGKLKTDNKVHIFPIAVDIRYCVTTCASLSMFPQCENNHLI